VIKIKDKGLHYLPGGQKVINLILSQMNNNRLSTSESTIRVDRCYLSSKISQLLSAESNYEEQEDGRILIRSKNVFFSSRKKTKVALIDDAGLVFKTFDTMSSCGSFLGIYGSTVKYKIQNNKQVLFNNKLYHLKIVEEEI